MNKYILLVMFLAIACSGSVNENKLTKDEEITLPNYNSAHQEQMAEAERAGIVPISDPLNVETGLDVLVNSNFEILGGMRVGVITNHTGLTKSGQHLVDLFHNSKRVNLVSIFGPEHGVRGLAPGGNYIKSEVDSVTGVPVYSLYSKTKQPTKDMLDNIDALVFDIQDVGARFYTYVYTMALAMESAANFNKKFFVLDRPNPITGSLIEGPMLQDGFESFVGMYKLPVRHGMTVGELARLFKGEGWIQNARSLDLRVIKMKGWERGTWLDQTDVPWVGPSPSMKTLATATVYPGTCFLEGTNVSEGRGTDKPFEMIGAPWLDSRKLANELNKLSLNGVAFQPIEFSPVAILPAVPNPKYKDDNCDGVFIRVVQRHTFQPVKTGIAIIWTIANLYPDKFEWLMTIDRLYGSGRLRNSLDKKLSLEEIMSSYDGDIENFKSIRKMYLWYE